MLKGNEPMDLQAIGGGFRRLSNIYVAISDSHLVRYNEQVKNMRFYYISKNVVR